jgi:hypothetical protein
MTQQRRGRLRRSARVPRGYRLSVVNTRDGMVQFFEPIPCAVCGRRIAEHGDPRFRTCERWRRQV